ncbi:MAG: hypothetical protein RMM08_05500 [Armatimonadota bacterium]|nr:hypothetical protein [bacterium]MDW8320797.1 hypothetical protein [Armatimonadota bacterium]
MSGWEVVAWGFGVLLGSAGLLVFFVPLIWIISHYSHKVKIERMRLQAQTQGTEALRKELEALRQQFQQLRETNTQFVLSSDSSLTTLREKIERLEERLSTLEQQTLQRRL